MDRGEKGARKRRCEKRGGERSRGRKRRRRRPSWPTSSKCPAQKGQVGKSASLEYLPCTTR
eukprot:1205230-Pleurochrysis_carterae.AAC.1